MLRYCYSNDIPDGITKFIQTCTVCMKNEFNHPNNVSSQSAVDHHHLMSSHDSSKGNYHFQPQQGQEPTFIHEKTMMENHSNDVPQSTDDIEKSLKPLKI